MTMSRLRECIQNTTRPRGLREISTEECQSSFRGWAASNLFGTFSSPNGEFLSCPLLACQKDFADLKSCLRHLDVCSWLSNAWYWCPFCRQPENFLRLRLKGSNSKLLRSLGSQLVLSWFRRAIRPSVSQPLRKTVAADGLETVLAKPAELHQSTAIKELGAQTISKAQKLNYFGNRDCVDFSSSPHNMADLNIQEHTKASLAKKGLNNSGTSKDPQISTPQEMSADNVPRCELATFRQSSILELPASTTSLSSFTDPLAGELAYAINNHGCQHSATEQQKDEIALLPWLESLNSSPEWHELQLTPEEGRPSIPIFPLLNDGDSFQIPESLLPPEAEASEPLSESFAFSTQYAKRTAAHPTSTYSLPAVTSNCSNESFSIPEMLATSAIPALPASYPPDSQSDLSTMSTATTSARQSLGSSNDSNAILGCHTESSLCGLMDQARRILLSHHENWVSELGKSTEYGHIELDPYGYSLFKRGLAAVGTCFDGQLPKEPGGLYSLLHIFFVSVEWIAQKDKTYPFDLLYDDLYHWCSYACNEDEMAFLLKGINLIWPGLKASTSPDVVTCLDPLRLGEAVGLASSTTHVFHAFSQSDRNNVTVELNYLRQQNAFKTCCQFLSSKLPNYIYSHFAELHVQPWNTPRFLTRDFHLT